ncbi:o-succinylbenzoate synthase [Sporolactobacillus vineae]|uniref:o-succinylbenzoate synthase n=1 Tax=Sporolactobacillus vineae TaxID=444463 RepID=UPI000288DBD6|nr:o-succinylbenzoate synthase [Sporolactobacillus vineae]
MQLAGFTLRLIEAPLKAPFITHLETVRKRQAIIIEATDRDGRTGFGEADPFSSPWYAGETIDTCWKALRDFLLPRVLDHDLHGAAALDTLTRPVRGNRTAKAGLSQAIWDLYAREKGCTIGKLFGATRKHVDAGAVIAAEGPDQALAMIEQLLPAGYKRFKIKISRHNDRKLLDAIRSRYPELPLMADANSAYTLDDLDHLKGLDAYRLQMIEQPLGETDLVDHAQLQRVLATPVCLDESIRTSDDARSALALGSCRVITVKMARVGGWTEAVRIHNLCRSQNVPVWCGGMIEFGIAKAHNMALAALSNFTLPGDLSPSSRYWSEDIIEPGIMVNHGSIKVPEGPGIGVSVNRKTLDRLTIARITLNSQNV